MRVRGVQPEDLERAYGELMEGTESGGDVSRILSGIDFAVDLATGEYLEAFSTYMSVSLSVRAQLGVYLIAHAVRLEYYVKLIDSEW